MRLRQPGQAYSREVAVDINGQIERADRENHKRGRDIEVGVGRLIQTDADGVRWSVGVDAAGYTIATEIDGSAGYAGAVPVGGTTGQALKKVSGTDFDVEWGAVSGSAAWGGITGTLADQTDVSAAINAKADTSHTHVIANITDFTDNSANWNTAYGWGDHASGGYLTSVAWGDVSGKPSTFTPSTHSHVISDVTGLQTALDAKADAVYTLTKATGNTSSASIANTTVDLVWNTPTIAGDGVTVSGSGVTLDDAGTYKFTVSFRADGGNSRNEGQLRTYLDTGAGYSELTNEIVTNYMSRITAQDEGTIMAIVALELDAGDKVKFSARSEADSTCTLIDAGTNLLVERVI